MNNSPASVLKAVDVTRTYRQGEDDIAVLRGLNLEVAAGEKVAIVGRSGSGKSTLLHVVAGLDTPQAGEVWIDGVDMARATNDRRAQVRGRSMGFVYQDHHLLPEFSAVENVAIPLRINGTPPQQSLQEAETLLCDVGLADRVTHTPSQLSGGERQRVAVARALAAKPLLVLADEPTGNLDQDNAQQVMALLAHLAQERQTSFLVVTHDTGMLSWFDRVLKLEQGILVPADDAEPRKPKN